jgi:hypothetical protein
MRIKILDEAETLTSTPSDISKATDVYLYNSHSDLTGAASTRTVSLYESDGITVVGSFALTVGIPLIINKDATQQIKVDSTSNVSATKVSYIG